ncbi:MAG: hypothetical protein M1433_03275 [Candidatus Parvarchaeota archaeon]|nr:hypothetical protein [Candidatus Parvarchaeota archaeon]
MTQVFCKTTLNEIMPAVRAAISLKMVKFGFTQIEISKKLGITQPAISQYKKKIRGDMLGTLSNNSTMGSYLDGIVEEIAKNGIDLNTKTCDICQDRKSAGIVKVDKSEFLCLADIKSLK